MTFMTVMSFLLAGKEGLISVFLLMASSHMGSRPCCIWVEVLEFR